MTDSRSGHTRVAATVFAAVLIAAMLPPSGARASVTFGDSLGVPPDTIVPYPGCSQPCTIATTISAEHLHWFRAPISGTIIRWRIQTVAGSSPQMLRFRVLEAAPGDELGPAPTEPFIGAGTSEPVTAPLGEGTFAYPTRLPVKAGDFIGLDIEGELDAVAVEEEKIRLFEPTLPDFGEAQEGTFQEYALLLNADIAAPPTSVLPQTCTAGGSVSVGVDPDPDPSVSARTLFLRVDGGAQQTIPVSGNPAAVEVPLTPGSHTLESRAEDSLGQLETEPRHATVLVGEPPTVSIESEQHRSAYPQGARASLLVSASDAADPLTGDPAMKGLALATGKAGRFTVSRTATDSCGNSTTASFTYTVAPAPRITGLALKRSGVRPRELRWHDSLPAGASFTVYRLRPGVLRDGVCHATADSAEAPARRRCTDSLTVAHLGHSDIVGENHLALSAIRFAAGRYLLSGHAQVSGGEPGPTARLRFTVG